MPNGSRSTPLSRPSVNTGTFPGTTPMPGQEPPRDSVNPDTPPQEFPGTDQTRARLSRRNLLDRRR